MSPAFAFGPCLRFFGIVLISLPNWRMGLCCKMRRANNSGPAVTDVFISYKRRMRPQVEEIARRLEELAVEVWFDANLEPGSTFSETIAREVRTANRAGLLYQRRIPARRR